MGVRFRRGAHDGLPRAAIVAAVRRDGWDPLPIDDPAGAVYPPHRRATAKLLVFLAGGMTIRAGGDTFACHPGDELVIPGDIEHTAWVGPEGRLFLWSEPVRWANP